MKLLITGGFGYLGGRLAQYLVSKSNHEIILGTRNGGELPHWITEAKIIQTIWDSKVSLEKVCESVDGIVHLAGMNAQDCAADPVGALNVNAVATARLIQIAVQQGVKRFIYLSTAHVYGSPLTGLITEESCPKSLHPYATSHRAGEDVVRAAHRTGEIEGIVIRLSNAFGMPAHKDANCWMLLVNDLCRQAATTQRMVLRSSGNQIRDFITLTDACRAIQYLLELPNNKLGDGVFNVGGGASSTIMEMTEYVGERFYTIQNKHIEIKRKPFQGAEITKALDYKIKKLNDTGFTIEDNVEYEIDQLIKFCIKYKNDLS